MPREGSPAGSRSHFDTSVRTAFGGTSGGRRERGTRGASPKHPPPHRHNPTTPFVLRYRSMNGRWSFAYRQDSGPVWVFRQGDECPGRAVRPEAVLTSMPQCERLFVGPAGYLSANGFWWDQRGRRVRGTCGASPKHPPPHRHNPTTPNPVRAEGSKHERALELRVSPRFRAGLGVSART